MKKHITAKGVALAYSGDIPTIITKAKGALVKKMLELAEHHNIPVYTDADLTEVLSAMDTGMEIPEDLFTAISEVLAYCYRINKDFKEKVDMIFSQQ